jgi:hypothetical protein
VTLGDPSGDTTSRAEYQQAAADINAFLAGTGPAIEIHVDVRDSSEMWDSVQSNGIYGFIVFGMLSLYMFARLRDEIRPVLSKSDRRVVATAAVHAFDPPNQRRIAASEPRVAPRTSRELISGSPTTRVTAQTREPIIRSARDRWAVGVLIAVLVIVHFAPMDEALKRVSSTLAWCFGIAYIIAGGRRPHGDMNSSNKP